MRVKTAITIVLALAVGLAATAAAMLAALDPNSFRPTLESRIEAATGHRVQLGPLDLAVGLTPRMVARDVTVASPAGTATADLARIATLEVAVRLWPLLTGGGVQIDRLIITGAAVHLERAADGRANWQPPPRAGAAPQPSAPSPATDTAKAEPGFAIERLEVMDSHLTLVLPGHRQELRLARASTAIRAGEPMVIEAAGQYRDQAFRVAGSLPSPSMLGAPTLPLDLTGQWAGVDLALAGALALAEPRVDMRLTVAADRAARLLELAGQTVPPAVAALGAVRLEGRVEGALTALRLDGLTLSVQSEGGRAVLVATGSATPQADLALVLEGQALERLVPGLPSVPTLRATGRLRGTPQMVSLSDLVVEAAPLRLTGAATLDVRPQRPKLAVTLATDQLTLGERASAPAGQASGASPASPSPTASARTRLLPPTPLPPLPTLPLDLALEATIGEVVLSTGRISQLSLAASLEPNGFALSRLSAQVAEGTVRGSARLGAGRQVRLELTGQGLSVAALAGLLGQSLPISAPLAVSATVEGAGETVAALAASLSGPIALTVGKGTVPRSLLERWGVNPRLAAAVSANAGVPLDCVVVRGTAAAGVVTVPTLLVALEPVGLISQGGRVSLVDESLSVPLEGRARQALVEGLIPPFTVRGTLMAPTITTAAGDAITTVLGVVTGVAGVSSSGYAAADLCAAALAGRSLARPAASAPATQPDPGQPGAPPRPSLPGLLDNLLRR